MPRPAVIHWTLAGPGRPALRMVGRAGDVVPGVVGPEFVELQEGVEAIEFGGRDDARHAHARRVTKALARDGTIFPRAGSCDYLS
jgi:hypothetical protein